MQKQALFDVPISLHIFNRPLETRKVFEEIKKVRPKVLFVTADGPRENKQDDRSNCALTRAIIDEVDWDCKVYKNYSDTNKGSFKSTSEGITWVFTHVERAIILEDDCIPHPSFFTFCEELLDYYENDTRISMISGNNFQLGRNVTKDSYYFSRYTHIWGWATWKRTWDKVDFTMKGWPEFKRINGLKSIFCNKKSLEYWGDLYQDMYDKKRKLHWDYLLSLSSYMNNTLTILPNKNLISNIGFGKDASNCKEKGKFHCLDINDVVFPLKHPSFMSRFVYADDLSEKEIFSTNDNFRSFIIKKLPFVARIIKKLLKSRKKLV